jgi:hypothetical protein
MQGNENWRIRFDAEIRQAENARTAGKEGMARVCARRAAGIVIGEYLEQNHKSGAGPSAYDRLRYLYALPGISPEVKKTIQHFLVRITPEHTLPVEADLVVEAAWLAEVLLGEPRHDP